MADKNKNLFCAVSNDLVAYLYGEMEPAGMSDFEEHLSGCTSCTDEFAGLSFARLGVYEWHREEFRHLSTPLIEIPYDSAKADDFMHSSWLDKLRAIFTSSPKWAAAGGAFAILAIGLGLTLVASNGFRNDDYLSENKIIGPASNATMPPAFPVLPKVQGEVIMPPEPGVEKSATPSGATVVNSNNPGRDRRIAKVSTLTRGSQKTSKRQYGTEQQAVRPEFVKRIPSRSTLPILSDFKDEEDNTLRLADLFADVDTRR